MRRLLIPLLLAFALILHASDADLLDVDHARLIARADLRHDQPASRSEAGLPIGNGRMGTLVWTRPTALNMQINRVDVFPIGGDSNSFPERHTDYCGGCAFVDLSFPGFGAPVFSDSTTRRHLSCHDGLATLEGADIRVESLAWHLKDVIALRVTDSSETPRPISVHLRMLRPAVVRTGSHLAESTLGTNNNRLMLTQRFSEGGHYCGSAVAVGVLGRESVVRQTFDEELRLDIQPGRGEFTVLISSAAGLDPDEDLVSPALARLDAAADEGFARLLESNQAWWSDFWSKSMLHLTSEDGVADQLEQHYNYYLYLMASTSRGRFATKFNGMLWTTGGDPRKWGAQYWGANQSCLYNPALLAANHAELLDPHFNTLLEMRENCALAARQQWGSQGLFIPETVTYDGLAPLPDDIAAEMRELYLMRQPWDSASTRFLEYARLKQPHSSRWNWKQSGDWADGRWVWQHRGYGPFGPVTHIFSRGAKIAFEFWLRYEYTLDEDWLREQAYPMIRGVAEFYRHFPNLERGDDGRYHIHHVNSNEPLYGGHDTDEEISAMIGILPVAIRAATLLEVDPELRASWQSLLDQLAPLTRSDHPRANVGRRDGPPVWIKSLEPVLRGRGGSLPDRNTMPMWFFDLCNLESDPARLETANATFDAFFREGIQPDTRIGVLSKLGIAGAILGRDDAVRHLLPNQIHTRESPALANRMDLREGFQTTSAQRLGRVADALHRALCQSAPAAPAEPSIIRVFPAWPREWNADFTLLCRGGFLVSSSMQNGRIGFVEIRSQAGGECRLRNPWPDETVTAHLPGGQTETHRGSLLTFDIRPNETLLLVHSGTDPDSFRRTIPAQL